MYFFGWFQTPATLRFAGEGKVLDYCLAEPWLKEARGRNGVLFRGGVLVR